MLTRNKVIELLDLPIGNHSNLNLFYGTPETEKFVKFWNEVKATANRQPCSYKLDTRNVWFLNLNNIHGWPSDEPRKIRLCFGTIVPGRTILEITLFRGNKLRGVVVVPLKNEYEYMLEKLRKKKN